MRRVLPALILCAAALAAEPGGLADPPTLIGMDPPSLLDALGPPQQVLSWRGDSPDQDNIIFFYPDFISVFWYRSRVWQLRFDRRYAGPVLGFFPGMTPDQAEAVAPGRLEALGDSRYLTIETFSYPLRLRLVFSGGQLADIYLYRSDY